MDWKCRDFQFEVGKTFKHEGKVEACASGFHACEHPLNVFEYYAPATSRFAEVELRGDTSRHGSDTKIAAAEITIKAELKIPDLVARAIQWVVDQVTTTGGEHVTGDRSAASATGYQSAASATGDQSAASATGDQSAASATGYRSAASATGDRSQRRQQATGPQRRQQATGPAASATGYQSAASATGDRSAASATGDGPQRRQQATSPQRRQQATSPQPWRAGISVLSLARLGMPSSWWSATTTTTSSPFGQASPAKTGSKPIRPTRSAMGSPSKHSHRR
jgi:hypothetical protein